ncbi:hypothetical protein SAMN05216582_10669 [Selenomonas ruminantium]|uniref:Porin n=1 Tax=Selenomonas ruminantium TaxID=971 RepID=A0A1M6T4H0_SELRU|nr:hypothetical protein [Selenomonas ruminantium]SHK51786.1 hypothetical protein SAMN05216582_10669 [Selenomonas ruminantium]
MTYKKKTAAVLMGLTLGMSGSVFAAPAADGAAAVADQDLAARIAAIEAQQQQLTQQLEALKKENAKLKRTSKVAESNKNAIKGLKDAQDRFKLYGFLRASYQKDSDRAKMSGHAWDTSEEQTNNRFYLNLMADYKLTNHWTGHFQSETNQRYSYQGDGTYRKREDGQIQRIWATGNLKNGVEINVGRKWNMLGQQMSLIGCTTDGIDATVPVTKRGLRVGGFYYGMAEYDNADFAFWGPMVKGPVGHNFDVFLAYAAINKNKDALVNKPYDGNTKIPNPYGNRAFVVSAATNVVRNLRLTGDYVQSNHKFIETNWGEPGQTVSYVDKSNANKAYMVRLDYKWTNPDVPHSFSAFTRYHDIQRNSTIWNDDNWGSLLKNTKGWTVGCSYVPVKNVQVELLYSRASLRNQYESWYMSKGHRNLYRAQVDLFF